MFLITSVGRILIDGQDTGLGVFQGSDGTHVYRVEDGAVVQMPHPRYSLSCNKPASGIPGLTEFVADVDSRLSE